MHFAQRIKPGDHVDLDSFPAHDHGGLTEEEARALHADYAAKLEKLEGLLYAAKQTSFLFVLQGMDTSGKDGVVRGLMGALNPQTCRVAAFKSPTELELGHDFLWRAHAAVPQRGSMAIFNRSHYEDVLVVRVHDLAPEAVWKKRYEHINAFEKLLTDSNTVILKFFLHISKEEQEQRLLEREKEVDKAWKLAVGDWKEREHWSAYRKAYEDALEKCSTEDAPWFVVPANHKWYRDLAIIQRIVEALETYHDQWHDHLREVGEQAKREIAEFRRSHPQ